MWRCVVNTIWKILYIMKIYFIIFFSLSICIHFLNGFCNLFKFFSFFKLESFVYRPILIQDVEIGVL